MPSPGHQPGRDGHSPNAATPRRRVPPRPRLVAVRPIVLDAALNYIQYPSLEKRLPPKEPKEAAAAGGMVSRLFGWGK